MKVLFVHQNCPGQFKHLAPYLAARAGNQVVFLTRPGKPEVAGVRKVEYRPGRKPSAETHHYLRLTEEGILNGQAAARAAIALRDEGFEPDVIYAHVGWGEALYLKEIWPRARLLGYFEWYYHPRGTDVGFLERRPPDLETACRIRTRNALHLLNLESVDWGVSPTRWQWSQHPVVFRSRISVIHDGIDTNALRSNPDATLELEDGSLLRHGDEVVTYVARNLEPYRGFPSFMRAAALIQQRRPDCHIVVVGGDGVSYGAAPKGAANYRELMLREVKLDPTRIHFLGRVPYDRFIRVLQVSAAHIYLTIPFVLSWSMLEAMAAGCLIIGSRTPPVEEVVKNEDNGLLVDFFSPEEIAAAVDRVMQHPDRMQRLRDAARRTVEQRYGLTASLKRQEALMKRLVTGEEMPPSSRRQSASATRRLARKRRRAGNKHHR